MWGQNRRTRTRVSRVAVVVVSSCLAIAGLSTAAQGIEIVDSGTSVNGTITSGQYNLPVVGACVYPVLDGLLESQDSLAGDYYVHETFAGACSDATGAYTVTLPPALVASLPAVQLLVVPQNSQTGAVMVPVSAAEHVSVQAATGSVSGYVTQGSTPVANFLVEVTDPTGAVIGLASTDKTGLYSAGFAATSELEVTVKPVGLIGENYSADVVSALAQDVSGGKGVQAVANEMQLPATATVTGTVYVQGNDAHSWQVVHADCRTGCTSSVVGVADLNGKFSFVLPAPAGFIVGYGGALVDQTFYPGLNTLPTLRTVPKGGREITYGQAPATWFEAQPSVSFTKANTWNWSGASLESAPYSFKVSQAVASSTSALSPYTDPAGNLTGSVAVNIAPGRSVCMRAATLTALKGVGASIQGPAVAQCVSVPLDDRALKASSGWTKVWVSNAYNHTLMKASAAKRILTLKGVSGHRIGIVFARALKGGSFTVSVNGKVVLTVNTAGKTAARVTALTPSKVLHKASVTITTTSSRPVSIDGLAVLP